VEPGVSVACPYCGEPTWVAVDPDGGSRQRFVSDCEVCCRPIHARVTLHPDGSILAHARTEDDAG